MSEDKKRLSNQRTIVHQEKRLIALKSLMVYYKEVSETVIGPFIILNKNLHVVTANLAFYSTFKVRKGDTEGKQIYALGNNQWDSPELRELLEHILPKHRTLSNYSVTHDFPTIGRKTIVLNARQVDSKQLILLAMEDITAQISLKNDSDEMTANLVKQRDQLQRLNDAKEEFISLASHQLRTPASVVKQYAGMLAQGYAGKLTKKQLAMLDIVYESNERQLEIIEDLLRVARVDAGKVYLEKSSCDVAVQVESVIKQQAVLFKGRDQTVVLNKPPVAVMAFIDPKLMTMVIANLLDNAGKYSPHGGQVTIDIEQTDDQTVVSIKDSGVGIRKSDRQKLFKKFSRIENSLTNSVAGTGLGLYWAKKILDLHGGSIEVESAVHKGSTFTVRTPVSPEFK
jgi:two-component system, cell cycle sensor histidine kinase PleC